MDFYYISIASGIFSYGYIVIMTIGLTGNLCQMITFSRKTMRSIGTGILFLALSVSDTIYILDSFYVIIVYGFNVPDNSDFPRTCRLRHYFIYLSSNFSPWMLTISNLYEINFLLFFIFSYFSFMRSLDTFKISF